MIAIAREIRKKDKNAVKVLYNRYGRKLYGYAVSKWHVSEDEAWDLVYKTLYKIMDVIDKYTFENESRLNGFVYQVFINNLRNFYNERKTKQMETISLGEKMEQIIPEKRVEDEMPINKNPYMLCLKKVLDTFDDWKRVLMLMKAQDFSYEEISKYVDRPAGQLKVYYMRAKQILVDKVNECVNNS